MKTILRRFSIKTLVCAFFVSCLLCSFSRRLCAANVSVQKSRKGWELLVDGKPFFVKGMCYIPTPVGEGPDQGTQRDWMTVDDDKDGRIDAPYQSWVDTDRNDARDYDEREIGDFMLLREMGCNAIRVYHSPTTSKELQAVYGRSNTSALLYNHKPNKALLRDLHTKYGIYTAMGNFLGAYAVGSGASWDAGTDYTDPEQRRLMMLGIEDMVREYKDEEFLLIWIIGNENNYAFTHTNAASHPEAYATFVNEVARRIKQLDPRHPVCLSNGDTDLLPYYARCAPDIDIFGANSYRKGDFGDLWKTVAETYDKPVILTEYGISHPPLSNGVLDENLQARAYSALYRDIARHSAQDESPGNALGGFAFQWLDNWWEDGDPWSLNTDGKNWNHEMTGFAGQGNGSDSARLRHLRKIYYTFKSLWEGEESR